MRHLIFITLVALLVPACVSEDAGPIYLETEYQVRCVRCEPRAPDNPIRKIEYLSGENGFDITCQVTERGGNKVVTMEADFSDAEAESRNYSLRLRLVSLDKSDPGPDCQVTVREGSNTYEGGCTAGEPDEEHPCKISLSRDGDDAIAGSIMCEEISNKANKGTKRHVVAPLSTDEAAEFKIYNCTDL